MATVAETGSDRGELRKCRVGGANRSARPRPSLSLPLHYPFSCAPHPFSSARANYSSPPSAAPRGDGRRGARPGEHGPGSKARGHARKGATRAGEGVSPPERGGAQGAKPPAGEKENKTK